MTVLWFFLTVLACYLNCLPREVLAHQFWALVIFTVLFSFLDSWTNRINMGTKWSSWIYKKYSRLKKQHAHCVMIILCQGDFQEQIKKLVCLSLYTSENCSEKTKPGRILYPVSNPSVSGLAFRNSQPSWSLSLQ